MIPGICHCLRTGYKAAIDARNQRVRAQPVGSVIAVFTLAAGEDAGNTGRLLEIDPKPTHGVVHAGKNLHRSIARIVAHKLLVDFENAFELAVERRAIDVCQVEVDHGLAIDAELVLIDDFVDGAGGDIPRHEIAILWIPLLQKIPAIRFGNAARIALVAGRLRHPHAAALTTCRL